MAITVIPTFNPCERPNCPGEPQPEFISYPATSSHLVPIPVVWRIINNNIPTSTQIRYSLNNTRLNQIIESSTRGAAYTDGDSLFSDIPVQFETGTLYMRAQATINGNIYYSDVATVTIQSGEVNCFPEWQVDDSTDVYIEYTTYSVPDQIQVLGNFNKDTCEGNVLYDTGCVSSKFYSKTPSAYPPTQFNPSAKKYAGDGLYITSGDVWHDCFQINKSDFPIGLKTIPNCENTSSTAYIVKVLGPDFDVFRNASTTGSDADCIEVKELTATVHYQTYTIKDWIVIYAGDAPNPCLDPRDTEGLLWESGCVGTRLGEGPGVSGGDYGASGKFDTFKYTEDDIPFTVSVLPGCDPPGTGTLWCATVYYADGTVAWSDCGDETPVCYDVPPEPECEYNFQYLDTIDTAGKSYNTWGDGQYIYATIYSAPDELLKACTFDGQELVEVGSTPEPAAGFFYNVWGDENYIYVSTGNLLRAYTFDGATFSEVGSPSTPSDFMSGLHVADGYIYAADDTKGLAAYSFNGSVFTDRGNIVPGAGYASSVWAANGYVYLANSDDGLRAYTHDGVSFTPAGNTPMISVDGYVEDVWADEDYVYTACYNDGIRIYTHNGSTFTLVAEASSPPVGVYTIWGDDNYIYVNTDTGMSSYTFDGSSLTLVSTTVPESNIGDIWGDGNYLYTTNGSVVENGLLAWSFECADEIPQPLLTKWTVSAPGLDSKGVRELISFDGKIYGSTYNEGRLYEWEEGDAVWTEVAPQLLPNNGVFRMIEHAGTIFGGGFSDSFLIQPALVRWNGAAWENKGLAPLQSSSISGLVSRAGTLYVSTAGSVGSGELMRWDGASSLIQEAPALGTQYVVRDIIEFGGEIYGCTNTGQLFKWDEFGTGLWVEIVSAVGEDMQHLAVYDNGSGSTIYGVAYASSILYQWDGASDWNEVTPDNSLFAAYSMKVHNGKLYAAGAGNNKLAVWNDIDAWEIISYSEGAMSNDFIFSLAVLNNKMYGSGASYGRLYQYDLSV